MAELIVDLLEAVEVDHRAGQRVAVAVGAGHFFFQPCVERPEVGQAGEAVGLGEGAVMLFLRGELQRPIHARHQLLLGERLGEIVGGAEREALRFRLRVALRGKEDHRRVGGLRVAAQAGERAEPVHAGQEEVEQDQIGIELRRALQSRLSVTNGIDVVVRAEQFGEDHARVLVVLDHEDERLVALSGGGGGGFGRRGVFAGDAGRFQAGGDAAGDLVGGAAGVVRAGLDGRGRIRSQDHDRADRLRQLAHGDGAGQIVGGTDEGNRRAGALGHPGPRQRLAQRLRGFPGPDDPDVHVRPRHATHARQEGSDSAGGTPRCRWRSPAFFYRR